MAEQNIIFVLFIELCKVSFNFNTMTLPCQSYSIAEIVPQDNILANENLAHHEGLLIEEMEPNSMLHLLRSRGVLSEAQYIEIRRESDRREKAQILIEMTKQELINRSVFWQSLVQTHCDRAINYIIRGVDGANPLNPSE